MGFDADTITRDIASEKVLLQGVEYRPRVRDNDLERELRQHARDLQLLLRRSERNAKRLEDQKDNLTDEQYEQLLEADDRLAEDATQTRNRMIAAQLRAADDSGERPPTDAVAALPEPVAERLLTYLTTLGQEQEDGGDPTDGTGTGGTPQRS